MKKIYYTLLLVIPFFSMSQVNLTQGLMAYYPFNGNAQDASGNGNHATFNNAVLTTDRLGNANSAYGFDGISNYIKIPNSSSLNSNTGLTYCAWVKVKGYSYNSIIDAISSRVLTKGIDNGTGVYSLGVGTPTPPDSAHGFFYGMASLVPNAQYTQKNQWYFVVFVDNQSTATLYVNNIMAYSNPFLNHSYTNSQDLYFGKMNDVNYPYGFYGELDDVRIYNRALNTAEITALYTATPLPVTLTSFFGQKKQNDINLTWTNTSETNHALYELQRSTVANNFNTIAAIQPTGKSEYTYTDVNAVNIQTSNVSYRLKMVSKDGNVTYSKVVLIPLNKKDQNIITNVYPNPFNDKLDIGLNITHAGSIGIALFDMSGKQLYSKQFTVQQGFSTITVTDIAGLAKGTYTLQLTTEKGSFTKQLIKAN